MSSQNDTEEGAVGRGPVRRLRPEHYTLASLLLLLVACLRVASTYPVFSETADEPMHISAGMQILEEQRYAMQLENPPLPRVAFGMLPHLAGLEYQPDGSIADRAHRILFSGGRYVRNLGLARAGNLIFFIIAALAVWGWAHVEAGKLTGLLAMLLFTTQPALLGHGGLATHDVPALAGVAASLFAFILFLRRPGLIRMAGLGVAFGFAILCKFSSIGYVPLACAAILAVRLANEPATWKRTVWRMAIYVPVALLVAGVVIWAGYGFTVGTIGSVAGLNLDAGDTVTSLLAPLWNSMPLPAPRFFAGVAGLAQINRSGFLAYACGMTSYDGWWWYFPLAIALKTTIPFLLLIVAAIACRKTPLEGLARDGAAASAAILLPAMLGHLNLGIRYVLPIFAPLTIVAAASASALLLRRWRVWQAAGALLISAHLVSSIAAHPHYMAYFNAIAGRDPSYYLVDSNLDWGQDALLFVQTCHRENIRPIAIAVFTSTDLRRLGIPRDTTLLSDLPVQGWVAISDTVYRMGRANGSWDWLKHRRYRRIGRSIRVYRID
ncbi:MAG TPA: glycosyltransferase family 39 protein [Thermoanaerobaculia bacterium]|nr:glycosyltransferase family 39 protein [Thermoanaerobaculia bacterium]